MGALTGAVAVAKRVSRSGRRSRSFPPLTHAGPVAFGPYMLLDLLAVGGTADVYLAATGGADGLPPLVAVKRLLPVITATPEFVSMFADEARVMRRLEHPGLPRVYEYGRFAGAHYIAMELVRGLDLRTLLNRINVLGRRMWPTMAAWVAARVCRALARAHGETDAEGRALRLIHRDVSPGNLMLGWDGEVKLIDFGIAKHSDRSMRTTARVIKGTVGYMSPEQAAGEPLDQRSDLFSLGSCLFEMLTGLRLFWDLDRRTLLRRVREGRVCSPSDMCPDIPDDLSTIVLDALQKDPDRRPRSAALLAHRLEAFIQRQGAGLRGDHVGAWMRSVFPEAHAAEERRLAAATARWRCPAWGTGASSPQLGDATDLDATLADLWLPDFSAHPV